MNICSPAWHNSEFLMSPLTELVRCSCCPGTACASFVIATVNHLRIDLRLMMLPMQCNSALTGQCLPFGKYPKSAASQRPFSVKARCTLVMFCKRH
jgi:hypothetical protein